MRQTLRAHHPSAGRFETDAVRPSGAEAPRAFPIAPGHGPAELMLGLQRSAGNAAVTSIMGSRWAPAAPTAALGRAHRAPTAPAATTESDVEEEEQPTSSTEGASPEPAEEAPAGQSEGATEGPAESTAEGAAGAEGGSAAEGAGEAGATEGPAESAAEGAEEGAAGAEEEHSPEEQAEKQAEGEGASDSDEVVPSGGGGFPIAEPIGGGSGFTDGGRRGSVRFEDASLEDLDPSRDGQPRAFVAGGRTGTKAWAGGGGAGPKGNQEAGSIQTQVAPKYDSYWGGVLTNADAWVIDGTGIADVKRDYVSSDAGDQGNGWYVTPAAAAALDRHEQRHVSSSKDTYDQKIQPVLDRVANSRTLGKGKTYKSSEAKAYLSQRIGWASGMKEFVETDQAYNAPQSGQIDLEDLDSAGYPHRFGPVTVAGKDYPDLLKIQSEPDPK